VTHVTFCATLLSCLQVPIFACLSKFDAAMQLPVPLVVMCFAKHNQVAYLLTTVVLMTAAALSAGAHLCLPVQV
jgi:hypothetical protein